MADLRAVLTEHGEDYDRDCQQHSGCTCGWPAPVPDYTGEGDYAMEHNHAAWVEHVVDHWQRHG